MHGNARGAEGWVAVHNCLERAPKSVDVDAIVRQLGSEVHDVVHAVRVHFVQEPQRVLRVGQRRGDGLRGIGCGKHRTP